MTPEEKDLLLKDLCARLPYGVKIIQGGVVIETLHSICKVGYNEFIINPTSYDMYNGFSIEAVKPYLRPMSSMTEEEEIEYDYLTDCSDYMIYSGGFCGDVIDWLLSHHFDYRGLIEKGLALEAPKDMYNF